MPPAERAAALVAAGGISNRAFAGLARQHHGGESAATLELPAELSSLFGRLIEGPLRPGETQEADGLVVSQADAARTTITYGDSSVTIRAPAGEQYAFAVGLPAPGEEPPQPQLGPWGFVNLPDPEAPAPLRQRVVRITATTGVHLDEQRDPLRSVQPLVVHPRYVSRGTAVSESGFGLLPDLDVSESADDRHAQLHIEDTIVRIEAPERESPRGPAEQQPRRPFSYWLDPEWSGSDGLERRLTIAAAPGVVVKTGSPTRTPPRRYGRRLVEEVVRVPHAALLPAQGTRFAVDDLVGIEQHTPGLQLALPGLGGEDEHAVERLVVATGLAGVTVVHPWTGAEVSLRPANREVGAAYAWQVLPPEDGRPGEIRAVVGPGVNVELREPLPPRLQQGPGPYPTPRPEQAGAGEGLAGHGFELSIVEVFDAGLVPPQGTPLNINHFLARGTLRRPDVHSWIGTNDLPFELARAGLDVGVGMVPIVGDLVEIAEFTYALFTDRDRWGREVTTGDKVLMGLGAVIGLIPGVGGIGTLLRGSMRSMRLAAAARAWGKTPEQLELILLTVRRAVPEQDQALVRRALRALERGDELEAGELAAVQQIVSRLGGAVPELRQGRRIIGVAAAVNPEHASEIAEAAGRSALHDDRYLQGLAVAVESTGEAPQRLVAPLARSGAFASGDEAAAAVEQALRDAVRRRAVDVDAAIVEHVARQVSSAVDEILQVTPQSRRLAVSQPQLVAQYEQLATNKIPGLVRDLLAAERQTARRARLAQLRVEFDQLRAQVGAAHQLEPQQRARAMQILREARDIARRDFGNLQTKVTRRLHADPELRAIEQQLRATGDVQGRPGRALRVRVEKEGGEIAYEPLNIEHRVRLSDNPWMAKDPHNLLLTDAAQNQQYLEAVRQYGSVWPTDDLERFVVTHGLHDQAIDFRPGSR